MDTLVTLKPKTYVVQHSVSEHADVRAFSQRTLERILRDKMYRLMRRWNVTDEEKRAIEHLFTETLKVETEKMFQPYHPSLPYLMVATVRIGKPVR